MDSEESRPGSSSSNTSISSEGSSRRSSPNGGGPRSPPPQSPTSRNSISGSSDEDDENPRNIPSGSPMRRASRQSSSSSRISNFSNSNGRKAADEEDGAINMSHEDLSDVSDLEGSRNEISRNSFDDDDEDDDDDDDEDDEIQNNKNKEENQEEENLITDLRQKLDKKKHQLKAMENRDRNVIENGKKSNGKISESLDDNLDKKHDEDALDFEAEEGECQELSKDEEKLENELGSNLKDKDDLEEGEELEEGEVSDEEEKRPEETEPKPVCRFYTRGQCTWGMSCRFLHPGVTDKGNYTMFDMVRPVPIPPSGAHPPYIRDHFDFRPERPQLHHRLPAIHHPNYPVHDPRILPTVTTPEPAGVAPISESPWERGLRTAKDLMRKANKRKEQDMDFEDKKMNLTLSPDEVEKENYYARESRPSPDASPPPQYIGHPRPPYYSSPPRGIPTRPGGLPPVYDEVDPYGRTTRYRELPPHRMPHYEDESSIRRRPTREVIVQRVEPVGRGDEWNDPWMRSKSPSGRERGREPDKRGRRGRSYSSNSSYSSSSSTSRSGSSSESSRSPSPERRKRYNSSTHHRVPTPPVRRHIKPNTRGSISPSNRRRRSPTAQTNAHSFYVNNEVVKDINIKMKKNYDNMGYRRSPPPIKKHGRNVSPSPISDKRAPMSPISKRKKISSPPRKIIHDKTHGKRRRGGSTSSGTGSSDTSGSESESSYSSSSSSSSHGKPVKRSIRPDKSTLDRKLIKKAEAPKKRSPISIEIKKPTTLPSSSMNSLERDSNSNSSSANNKKATRREELLKQLRAVEDAIARKKSKLN